MDITEKAKAYAEGKVLETLTAVIEAAYIEGYNEGRNVGYKEAINSKKHEVEVIDGVEYIDLGLPSGTKWASDFLKDEHGKYKILTFYEAMNLSIPTKEQYLELLHHCKSEDILGRLYVLETSYEGPNGNQIKYHSVPNQDRSSQNYDATSFWIRNDEEKNYASRAVHHGFAFVYKGQKLPVLLVKQ